MSNSLTLTYLSEWRTAVRCKLTCIQHFPEGKPTESFPDPVQASFSERLLKVTPVRRPPKRRPESEPPVSRKKRNILSEIFSSVNNENINEQHIDNSSQSTNEFCADVSVQTDFHQGN
ncbi:uncharacterized protein LOC132743904 [Ruditapes philippinarum]|uniref:uncharacterized protein LOC132743904 n=1 Tax=Ruditapes philippinarum TaxID=129788 RepID=UPI00295BA1FC|nr:uncharacterized protein LOC132743904 [Ruditapes philippinarum]